MIRAALAAVIVAISGCTASNPDAITLRVWHFWSEPNQEREFQSIVGAFERTHPTVRIELTPLQWSEGKAKLQIAFASGTPPDVVHLGAEWVAEFASVLRPLAESTTSTLRPEFRQIGTVAGTRRALPWTVNARVLFIHRQLELPLNARWQQFVSSVRAFHRPPDRYGLGLCISDPHNVLKRCLPFVWALGADLMATYPFSVTCTARTAAALDTLVQLASSAVVEPSRQLDARLRRGELGAVLSGVWMLADSAVRAHYSVLPAIPPVDGADGASILSGDCFAIARSSTHAEIAEEFLAYLATWDVASAFCWRVPDAGFPAQQPPSSAALDSLLARGPDWRAAYNQTLHSRLLPSPPVFLDAERAVEEAITAVLYGRTRADVAIRTLATQLQQYEQSVTP
jgi:ABC-type glycerol-3-phosphate transport system substrate-binding protein